MRHAHKLRALFTSVEIRHVNDTAYVAPAARKIKQGIGMKQKRAIRRTKTWYGRTERVFSIGAREMNAQLARLFVLYEDLKIETMGMARRRTYLDYIGPEYRLLYFLRASLQTFREANSVFTQLAKNRDFGQILKSMSPENKKAWKEATKFFHGNAATINRVRNIVGGHFSSDAGKAAVDALNSEQKGKVEIRVHRSRSGAGIHLHFAGEFAALGVTAAKNQAETEKDYYHRLMGVMKDAHLHFTNAVHGLCAEYVIPRFQGR